MAEAPPLTIAGNKPTKDTPVAEKSQPRATHRTHPGKSLPQRDKIERDKRAVVRDNKRARPSTNTPSPKGPKPPQPAFKPIQLKPSITSSVEKLAKQGQVTNSPFLTTVHDTMEGNVLEMPPKGKPYRDYLDKDYEKEKAPKCAVAHYTMAALNKEVGDLQMTAFTATFGMLMIRHFREEDQIIQISNKLNEVLTTCMVNSHTNEHPYSEIEVEMFQEAKTKAGEVAMISYLANIQKFESQAPAEDKVAAQHHIDKFMSKIIKNFKGDVANNLEKLSHHEQDGPNNAQRKSALEWCKPVLTFVRDAVKTAVYTASDIVTQGEMQDYCTFAIANDKALAIERATVKSNITNLQSQVSAVTSAVGWKCSDWAG